MKLFVSYARDDKMRVDELTRRLPRLGHEVWLDAVLRGGQRWWDEILAQIAACDAFIAIVSRASLRSEACTRERAYAEALGKPILPVAVERMNQVLPRELSTRQVVDYSVPGEDAAFALAGALVGLPPAPPLPSPMPTPPPVPLSYLTDLVEELSATELTKAQQRRILDQLEPGLRSADPEERSGARQVLELVRGRDDLFADVERRIDALYAGHGESGKKHQEPATPAPPRPPRQVRAAAAAEPPRAMAPPPTPLPTPPKPKRSKFVTTLAVIGGLMLLLIVYGMISGGGPACFTDIYGQTFCG